MIKVKWDELKKYSDDLGVPIIWACKTNGSVNTYILSITHKGFFWTCTISSDSEPTEVADFEANYKGTVVELWVSKKVASLTEEVDYYVPPAGSKVKIISFHAEAPFNSNAVCKLLWDYNEAGESALWSTQGSSEIPHKPLIEDTDGVKKLAVSCDNGTLGGLLMSAYAKLLVIDNA